MTQLDLFRDVCDCHPPGTHHITATEILEENWRKADLPNELGCPAVSFCDYPIGNCLLHDINQRKAAEDYFAFLEHFIR